MWLVVWTLVLGRLLGRWGNSASLSSSLWVGYTVSVRWTLGTTLDPHISEAHSTLPHKLTNTQHIISTKIKKYLTFRSLSLVWCSESSNGYWGEISNPEGFFMLLILLYSFINNHFILTTAVQNLSTNFGQMVDMVSSNQILSFEMYTYALTGIKRDSTRHWTNI